MNMEGHDALHSFAPASLPYFQIKKLAAEGINNGYPIGLSNTQLLHLFRQIAEKADEGTGTMIELEKEFSDDTYSRRRYDRKNKEEKPCGNLSQRQ